jgi:hypothetical protein
MSLTPIPPERCGHVAPMIGKAATRPAASGAGRQGRCGHRRGSATGAVGGGTDEPTEVVAVSAASHATGQTKGLWGSMSLHTAIVKRFEHACAFRIAHTTISAWSWV